jgi:integrase
MSQTFNVVKAWLDNVAYSHSRSHSTQTRYPRYLTIFCNFAQTSPEEILKEYETTEEKVFKRKYAMLLKAWISSLSDGSRAPGTIADHVKAIKSFFMYNDLALGYLPRAPDKIVYHNRDIEKEEVGAIINVARPREKAFFAFMAQSGLRPDTICKLKFKDLETLDKVPCMVNVTEENTKGEYGAYFTFIAKDTIKYLNDYLSTRTKTSPSDYVFMNVSETGPMHRSNPSRIFQDLAQDLRKTGKLQYETKVEGKPAELRMYTLRKYFRNQASPAGSDYVNFWMGHALPQSSDKHYFPGKGERKPSENIIEKHRKLYAEKAMPFLRLGSDTPTETENLKQKFQEQSNDIENLRKELAETKNLLKRLEQTVQYQSDWLEGKTPHVKKKTEEQEETEET